MLLEAEGLRVAYGDIEAVGNVSFSLKEGELVSIIGSNGAGKTSILNALMGLIPSSGSVRFQGEEISPLAAHNRARLGIRLVPERARIFSQLTVMENLMTGAYGLRKKIPFKERLSWLFELFPVLEERKNQLGSTLSGGEQQQLAISRALLSDPRLLLVDEISMGLMPKLVDQVFQVLKDLNREHGLAILLVEQNALASLEISQRAYVLETGSIVLEGDARELKDDERVRSAYLGL
jgi:branched-chain amino acid transport system ATP-binding protein